MKAGFSKDFHGFGIVTGLTNMTEQECELVKQPDPQTNEEHKKTNEGDSVVKIIHALADRVDPLLELLKAFFERSLKAQQSTARFQIRMVWIALAVVALIVGISALLTYLDKIDGSTFTFLLGLVVGYVLTFVRDTIKPPEE
jgi:hypothetical protein